MLYNKSWDKKSNPVSDVLLKAAGLIEKHGLAKFTRHDDNGAMCFLGAIDAAQAHWEKGIKVISGDSLLTHRAAKAVAILIDMDPSIRINYWDGDKQYNDYRFPVADWNNAKDRTKEEVVETMRKAARTTAFEVTEAEL